MKRISNDVTHHGVQCVDRLDQVKETSIIDISVREWQLASSALGKIIVLNGPSSSGKTTLATKFEGYHVLSYDQAILDRMYQYFCTNPKVANIIQNAREFLTVDNLLSIMTSQKIKNNSYTEEQLDIIHSLRSGCRDIAA